MRILMLLALASPAFAQEAVDLKLKTVVQPGQRPTVEIHVFQPLKSLKFEADGSHGTKVRKTFGALKVGAVQVVSWSAPAGRSEQFAGMLQIRPQHGDSEEMPLQFEAIVLTPLEVKVPKEKVDLEHRSLQLTMSREAGRCDILIKDENGEVLHSDTLAFQEEPGGTPLLVSWPPLRAAPARIELRVYDKWDVFAGMALIPWQVTIPHEEVNFELDSADIRESERPKLDASHQLITDAIRKYKDLGPIKLYIAGHTDTLASREYNKKLSTMRARSIARYFRSRGLPVPIYSYGFGEERPLVGTPDETDEPRNRRVDYVIAVEPPSGVGWEAIR